MISICFFFNDTATTEIYTLSLHDALPIFRRREPADTGGPHAPAGAAVVLVSDGAARRPDRREHDMRFCSRSEEHTSELQSRQYLVCRLLLEKKKQTPNNTYTSNDHLQSLI